MNKAKFLEKYFILQLLSERVRTQTQVFSQSLVLRPRELILI